MHQLDPGGYSFFGCREIRRGVLSCNLSKRLATSLAADTVGSLRLLPLRSQHSGPFTAAQIVLDLLIYLDLGLLTAGQLAAGRWTLDCRPLCLSLSLVGVVARARFPRQRVSPLDPIRELFSLHSSGRRSA